MPTTPQPDESPFEAAERSFRQNIHNLRTFAVEVGRMVDERDAVVVNDFTRSLTAVFGERFAEITVQLSPMATSPAAGNDTDPSPGVEDSKATPDTAPVEPSAELKIELQRKMNDPAARRAFIRAITKFVN